ncbi:serpin family protein [Iningainema tapete]|uniref:Serpin family protein n=1 Tax=Iningainema tapete BLCC-T55 TaxID=2748662 RepID=A0A8J6XL89_9CYAN|nr:serpin family protein [Iningainema tapete]MBD2772941.1 serpin family protein [Iningainema tapete BLCC-T55]
MHRRYGVRWSRRYFLAAASFVFMSVLVRQGSSTLAHAQSPLHSIENQVLPPVNTDTIVASNNKFGFNLFLEILKKNSDNNIFISPSSVALALAMTYNGASGSTQAAMAQTLELQGISLEQINTSNKALTELLENPEESVQLNIANSLWVKQNFTLNPEFIQRTQDFYKAKVSNLDFNDPTAPSTINNWVSENTNGKINKIIEQISPDERLFLINAIYFKGSWAEKFDKQLSADYPFYLSSGAEIQHPMMSQSGEYRYYENEQFQAVSLPYGDGRLSFYIFLPQQNSNLKDFYQNLNAQNWEKWMTQFSKNKGFIRLPRFKMEYSVTLNDALKALGMQVAFSDNANFSAIAEDLAISEVKHKTFVEVNEEGTEAAAVTSIGIRATSVIIEKQPFRMIVDRPFFCAIRDNRTKTVLFMGSIENPQSR